MLIIPAIDLKDGHCVRLKQGDMDQATTFGEDPAAMVEALGSAAIAASADRDEGVAAFRAKRAPEFPGT